MKWGVPLEAEHPNLRHDPFITTYGSTKATQTPISVESDDRFQLPEDMKPADFLLIPTQSDTQVITTEEGLPTIFPNVSDGNGLGGFDGVEFLIPGSVLFFAFFIIDRYMEPLGFCVYVAVIILMCRYLSKATTSSPRPQEATPAGT